MKKKYLFLSLATLTLLTTLLFTRFNVVEAVPDSSEVSKPTLVDTSSQKSESAPIAVPDDSVLRLIPEETLGIIYCSSLLELDSKINTMI